MKVLLTRSNKIDGKAGEIVEVSPARADFLLRYGLAEPVTIREQIETPEKRTEKKKTAEVEKAEVPEKQTTGKTTRTAKAEPEKETKTAKAARKKA